MLGRGTVAPALHQCAGVTDVPHAPPGDRLGVDVRLDVGQRTVDVVRRQVPVPDLLEEGDRRRRADLGAADRPRVLLGLGLGVPEREGRPGHHEQFVLGPSDALEPGGDVVVEGARVLELGVEREHHLGVPGGEVAALVGVPGLDDHRVSLRAPRDGEGPGDVELRSVVVDVPDARAVGEPSGRGVRDDGVGFPGVPELPRRLDELRRPRVPVGVVEEPAAAEVRPVERVRARHDVPARAAAGQVVERGELLRELHGLVEGGLQGADETDVRRDPRQGSEDREGVRPPDDVEVVDPPLLLAEPQSLGEEQVVEAPALGVPGEVLEGRERDLALGALVAPDRRVVDAREVGGEVDLTLRAHDETPWVGTAYRLTAGAMPSRVRRSTVGRDGGSARRPAVTRAGTSCRAIAVLSAGVRSGRSRTPA